MRERGALIGDRYATLAVAVFGALCLVVVGVGVVATAAELLNTWEHYFIMERAIAAATPVTTALVVAALLVGLGAVARA